MAVTIKPQITKILLDLQIDPIDLYDVDNAEQTYMSAVREGINTLEAATKGKGDRRSRILREEFQGLLARKKGRKVEKVAKIFGKKKIISTSKLKPQALLPGTASSSGSQKGGMGGILDGILDVLKKGNKLDKKESEIDRKERQRQKRIKREETLESLKSGIGASVKTGKKIVSSLVSPFKNIWEKIANFLKVIVIGTLFNKALNWFGEEENVDKIKRIGRFLNFWWPSLLAGFALFFTPIGGLVSGAVGILTTALPLLVGLIAKYPILAAALAAGGLTAYFASKKNKTNQKVDASLETQGSEATVSALKEEQQQKNEKGNWFTNFIRGTVMGENAEYEKQIKRAEGLNEGGTVVGSENDTLKFNQGGTVVGSEKDTLKFNQGGTVAGSGNEDSVPAMLTPGEVVIPASTGNISKTPIMVPKVKGGSGGNITPPSTIKISNSVVLPAIRKEKPKQQVREGSTIPTFQISSNANSRQYTLVSMGIEGMV